jgi:hypothetical protein
MVLMIASQGLAGFAICVSQSGHIEIEFADSACCNPVIPSPGQADELAESEATDCAACVDHEIGNHSLLSRGGHHILNYLAQQNTISGKSLATKIAFNMPISFCRKIMPNQTQLIRSAIGKSSSPLRC